MNNNINKLKGPRAEIDVPLVKNTLKAFSDDTIAAAIQDIIFSLELAKEEEYKQFIKELTALLKEAGTRTRLEQSLIAQINLLQKRKPKPKAEEKDISKVFTDDKSTLDSLSTDLKLQLDITNYILGYFKKGDFKVVEQCIDVLLQKNVLINTVKNFIKKEIDFYISNQDTENIKRITSKYAEYPKLAPAIKEQLDQYLNNENK